MCTSKCQLIDLPKISDPRGSLTFLEGNRHIPFEIRRIYYLSNVPQNVNRGAHAHKALQQVIIAISGSFEIQLDDGYDRKQFLLSDPSVGLYICPMIWRDLQNFSTDAVCLVLASEVYDEDDYYRDYDSFIQAVKEKRHS